VLLLIKIHQKIPPKALRTSQESLRRRFLVLVESADGAAGAMLHGVRTVTSSDTSGIFNWKNTITTQLVHLEHQQNST